MKIKTITCHEVYNHGASLQEYALLKYLENLGHNSETIHYKPYYLSNNFKFLKVNHLFFSKNLVLKFVYIILKLPQRLFHLKRKRRFDNFSRKYIKTGNKLYKSNDDLKNDLPVADAYICGSDQIWNSFFENGKDPAFSVREISGKKILNSLGFENVAHVLDPVFLLNSEHWESLITIKKEVDKYIFIYDFDSNPLIQSFAENYKEKYGWKIITVNQLIKYADKNYFLQGPEKFLSLVKNAEFIISNSFHAVAFSIIFKKDFVVFNRADNINTRMRDLLDSLDLSQLLLTNEYMINNHILKNINYDKAQKKLGSLKKSSAFFLNNALK